LNFLCQWKGLICIWFKSHKQIPIDPQSILAKKHAHYASVRESSNQIQIKLQVVQNKLLNPSFDSMTKTWQIQTNSFKHDISILVNFIWKMLQFVPKFNPEFPEHIMPQTLLLAINPLQKSKMNLHHPCTHFIMPYTFVISPQHQAKFGYFQLLKFPC